MCAVRRKSPTRLHSLQTAGDPSFTQPAPPPLSLFVCILVCMFVHEAQVHDMDMFWCVALMLLVSSALNVRKSKGGDVLNREQTEEWKGWMQFMFLMYHYFSAHEVCMYVCMYVYTCMYVGA